MYKRRMKSKKVSSEKEAEMKVKREQCQSERRERFVLFDARCRQGSLKKESVSYWLPGNMLTTDMSMCAFHRNNISFDGRTSLTNKQESRQWGPQWFLFAFLSINHEERFFIVCLLSFLLIRPSLAFSTSVAAQRINTLIFLINNTVI